MTALTPIPRAADGGTFAPVPSIGMAATLSWFLVDLVAQGHALDDAAQALEHGVRTQARALRAAGVS